MTIKPNGSAPRVAEMCEGSQSNNQAIKEAAPSYATVETRCGDVARADPEVKTAFDVFGSELPDEFFADVFNQLRQRPT